MQESVFAQDLGYLIYRKMKKNIGLISLDANKECPPLSLMKISYFHKNKGDNVEIASPLFADNYDITYINSLFDFTDKSAIDQNKFICGGTGFDLKKKLPYEIENSQPDYELFSCDFSYQRYTTGCIRKCPFCVVWKAGGFKEVTPMNLNPKGKYIYLLDNNFAASKHWKENINHLKSYNQPVQFEGLDVRILSKNEEMIKMISNVKLRRYGLRMAWDNPEINLEKDFEVISKYIRPYKIIVYVLVGYYKTDRELDFYRIKKLNEMGFQPYVMPFDKKDLYQKTLTAWVNQKAAFRTHNWDDYYYYKTGKKYIK